MPTVAANWLEQFVARTLQAAGLTKEEAQYCAAASMFADLRGTDTHGVMYIIPRTLESISQGKTVPGASITTLRDDGAIMLVKGNGLVGPALCHQVMQMAISKAEALGVGMVCTYGGNPLGLLGYYPSLALEHGLVGLAMANTSPAMAPFGAMSRVFGTNPFAYAVPSCDENPILFDIATTAAASGKVSRAKRRGESVPNGWIIDSTGAPVTDPSKAHDGAMLPFGTHKGSGIALLVHLLTGALAGAMVGGESTHNNPDETIRGQSALFMAINPGHFTSRDDYRLLVDKQVRLVHEAIPLPGSSEVLLPGERGWREMEERQVHGVSIPDEDWSDILAAVEKAGLQVQELVELSETD